MTQRLHPILTISAVIFFILAFVLDVSYFGQDWTDFWKHVDFKVILLIFIIIIAVGLFLGFFLFRKRKYKLRLWLTFPIAFILFSLADISKSAISYYGLNEKYNYFSAKRDIKNDKIQILETGLILPTPNVDWNKQEAAKKITANYFGYNSIYLGCTVTNGINIYNSVMEDYLNKRNGENWKIRQRQMLDSIINSTTLK